MIARIPRFTTLAAIVVVISSCSWFLESVLSPDYPTNLRATDGENASSVTLTWNEPSITDNDGNERAIGYYEIDRDPAFGFFVSNVTSGNTTSWSDDDVVPGTLYAYRVRAVFADGASPSQSDYSPSDTGFAMDGTVALLHHSPGTYRYAVSAETWFIFPLQRGWRYHLVATDGSIVSASATVSYGPRLTTVPPSAVTETSVRSPEGDSLSALTFVAPSSETAYVCVLPPPVGPAAIAFVYGYE